MTEHRGTRPPGPRRAATADRVGVVEMRLSGKSSDITALLDTLAAAGVELTGTSRPYTNRRGTGVRVYTQARPALPPEPGADVAPETGFSRRTGRWAGGSEAGS